MKSPYDYALDILNERQTQLHSELERVEKELQQKQAELDSLNRYVKVLTNEKTTLLDSARDLSKAIDFLKGQSINQ
jgi:prefoldin subunit 5